MSGFAGTTLDDFLGGRVVAEQPAKGYRAGVDPVLLAGAVSAKPGQTVLELGCGVGVASLCLARRVEGLRLHGIERQEDYADLARSNAERNGADLTVVTGDLAQMPPELREMSFDHVIANPPYFQRDRSHPAADEGREGAMGEDTTLETWVKTAAKRLHPKGTATFIHRAERLPDLLTAMGQYLGSIDVQPLIPRRNRDARLVIIRARKGGKSPFRLHDSLIMHLGDRHERDGDDYTEILTDCLKHGKALPFAN